MEIEEKRVYEWPLEARLGGAALALIMGVPPFLRGEWLMVGIYLLMVLVFWRKAKPSTKVGACQSPTHWKQRDGYWTKS
ncbi:MAG: hypothetical protein AAGD14_01350 [Planctomycetota bacterium]